MTGCGARKRNVGVGRVRPLWGLIVLALIAILGAHLTARSVASMSSPVSPVSPVTTEPTSHPTGSAQLLLSTVTPAQTNLRRPGWQTGLGMGLIVVGTAAIAWGLVLLRR